MKNIFAISGSLREGSSNHSLLRLLGKLIPSGINYTIYGGLRDIPAFDPGLDDDTPPSAVSDLRKQLSQANGIIICTPEYAFGVPGALKNALDWTVSTGSFCGKPTALITASTGGENAHAAMIKILGAIDAKLAPETTLLIQFVRSKMDADSNVTDADTAQKLEDLLKVFINSG
ncbi:NADPH-dependent FMN reductase [Mucilaginibacter sp. BT774]|uniref:NADPH-dependent FMN reductase n=1 Tax=Mucilaginibacter sp. BT774 TaxID=3062276 RepID=UPI002675F1C0|nr:NADPH-dependent FMN reductase [Mucilaginibacter sp. BT774]MDO3625096.1 NADPH-dependent FMN reductase [Mucilaginibacter sp. BT774]